MATALKDHGPFALLALVGAAALGIIATANGEQVSALWMVLAAVSVHLIAYRYYSRFLAGRVFGLDGARQTPAHTKNDGLDYVPTNRYVLFGHHFAAIAGAGPLVGPVLAAQMGYLPGMLWILAGVVLAGAVQDFIILFISMRRDGRSLGELIRMEMGNAAGTVALFGAFMIMVIILAVLALIVVRALAESPWGLFTVAATVPLALFMGVYGRFIRPGKIAEVSLIGLVGLVLAIIYGEAIAASPVWGPAFTLTPIQLCWVLIGYGAIASVMPVWLLLAPRDYLSTFLKIGAVVALAIGLVILAPPLRMPALTQFVDGSGPVWSGTLFPFLFITIACGAVSGFHALISSGTTPKMIESEGDLRFIGYGAMLTESFVAVMALIAACVLDPAVYFAMNAPAALIGTTSAEAARAIAEWGFVVTPQLLDGIARDVGEGTILSRAGGAPTLAVGMAQILSQVIGGQALMAFWYHFAILFEALFILTTVDAGTRVARFMIQDLLGSVVPAMKETSRLGPNLLATALAVGAWGYFLYQGVTDPLGGINTLWPLFGISNQMLAAIALTLATVILFKMKRQRFAWVTVLPTSWLLICTMTAGWQKMFDADPRIGFLAHAQIFSDAAARGVVLAPAKSMAEMGRIVFNDRIDAGLCALFMTALLGIVAYGIGACRQALASERPTVQEVGDVAVA